MAEEQVPEYKEVTACYGAQGVEQGTARRAFRSTQGPASEPMVFPELFAADGIQERYKALHKAFKAKFGEEPELFARAPGGGVPLTCHGGPSCLQTAPGLFTTMHAAALPTSTPCLLRAGRVNLIGAWMGRWRRRGGM